MLGTLALNYWFTEPRHTLDIASARDIATLIVFVVTSVAVAAVVDSAARRRHRAVVAEDEADTLAMLNRTSWAVTTRCPACSNSFATPSVAGRPSCDGRGGDGRGHGGPRVRLDPARAARAATRRRRAQRVERLRLPSRRAREREELARQTEAARELEAGNRTRTALLAAVSHDLRTPLTGIRSAAETLRAHDDRAHPEDRTALLDAIVQSTVRLTTMVSDLLDMSRLQTGVVQPALVEVPLNEVVDRPSRHLTGAERVKVGLLPSAVVDPGLLERVLANLLVNALRYSDAVLVSGATDGPRVTLRVADRGPGVARWRTGPGCSTRSSAWAMHRQVKASGWVWPWRAGSPRHRAGACSPRKLPVAGS